MRVSFCILFFIFVLCVDKNSSNIPTYDGDFKCNKTIYVDNYIPGGRLVYRHSSPCDITIQTETNSHVGFVFRDISGNRSVRVHNDVVFFDCPSSLMGRFEQGCELIPEKLLVSDGDNIVLMLKGDNLTSLYFEMIFFSFHFNQCRNFESKCSTVMGSSFLDQQQPCLELSLVCDMENNFCTSTTFSVCGTDPGIDIPYPVNVNASLIAAIVLLSIIAAPFIVIVVCVCIRRYDCKCRRRSQGNGAPRSVQDIVRALIAESREQGTHGGYDNEAIDPSKFDPPPDYDSLEHTDGAKSVKADTNVSSVVGTLPSYNDAMTNSNDYFVCSHM